MTKKFFNIALTKDMIAQAYLNNESYNSYCFLVGPPSSMLPKGFSITNVTLVDGDLKMEYINKTGYNVEFYIENGNLFVKFTEGGIVMALVDLGNVIGPQGPQGETGATGATGPQGEAGISPTFVMGDGTGGTTAGHLYADYDHPYVPS